MSEVQNWIKLHGEGKIRAEATAVRHLERHTQVDVAPLQKNADSEMNTFC